MNNTGTGGYGIEVLEGFGSPFQEFKSFIISFEFDSFVFFSSVGGFVYISLYGVIDY